METEFSIKRLPSGNIEVNMGGDNLAICKLIAETMHKHFDTTLVILAAIPSAIDLLGMDRESVCEQIMNATGENGPQVKK